MTVPIKTISTAVAGVGLSGGLGYLYLNRKRAPEPVPSAATSQPQSYDPRPFQRLTTEEIDSRLTSGQIVTMTSIQRVRAIYTNRMASNKPVEDNYSINTIDGEKLIAGVYDGHIGPSCSELIKKQLPIYVARQLKESHGQRVENTISTAFETLDQDIQQRFYDLFPKDVARASEKDIREAAARNPAASSIIEEALTGSCACAVYLDGDDLYAANTGDSRVVIIRQEEDGSWTGRRLVEEQSPAHPAWRAHMISQHPADEADAIVRRNRVFGLIAVGGSFGDIMYKVPKDYQMNVLPYIPYEVYSLFARYHHRIVINYRTPPYLYAKPLVSHHKLQKGDRFVVLGTDGLWDELSWDSVRSKDGDQVSAELMSSWSTSKDKNAATHLMRQALLYDVVYKNIGEKLPVTDEVLEMSKRLTREPSRRYRDDMTITVIELNQGQGHAVQEGSGPVMEPEEVDVSQPRLCEPHKSSWYSGWIWSRL
ncbi:phosphatase 2C-like domain-containing protein [Zychaea mexicana]|uniref:phosphatase 2C-like domain-containing protein n=1 Tax=Zychaea mexicana TaxID=64656 RepID=UPI0022FE6E53|nr:phosphatase 2C-like domain-containing protein [Zychaea mexicana]KAI9488052.1 phosphatase 2C-like domain-containing protein [Zychaea mexicana]